MAKTARVIGDIIHDSLAIEAGAFIEGNIKRLEGAGRTSTVSSAGVSTASSGAAASSGGAVAAQPVVSYGRRRIVRSQDGAKQFGPPLYTGTPPSRARARQDV